MTWADVVWKALIPLVLLFFGIYGLTAEKKGKAVRPKLKLGVIDIPILQFSFPWYGIANVIGVILIALSIYLLIRQDERNIPTIGVSLTSVSYEYDDWNPKVIDLRTAHESGIPVSAGHSLKLFDLFVYVPEEITDYVVVAAIYGNDELIGLTESQRLVPGVNKLGDIEIKNYQHDTVDNAWRIQDGWEFVEKEI